MARQGTDRALIFGMQNRASITVQEFGKIASLFVALCVFIACANDADDSGSDGGATTSSLESYCASAATLLETCSTGGTFSTCETSTLENCNEVYGVERDEYIAARAECGFSDSCTDLSEFEQKLCLFQETENMAPTSQQMELGQVLCEACSANDVSVCLENFFFRSEPRNDGVVGVSGQGTTFVHLNPEVTTKIANSCVPQVGAANCWPDFFKCTQDEAESSFPASHVEACNPIGPSP